MYELTAVKSEPALKDVSRRGVSDQWDNCPGVITVNCDYNTGLCACLAKVFLMANNN